MPVLKINNHVISYNNQFAKQIEVYNLTTAIGSGYGSITASPTTGAKGFKSYLTQTPADNYIFYNYTEEGPGYLSAGNYIFGAGDGTVSANFIPALDSYFIIENGYYYDNYKIKNLSQDVVSATYRPLWGSSPETPYSEKDLNTMKSNNPFTISATNIVRFYMNNSSTTFTENYVKASQWAGDIGLEATKILTNNDYGVTGGISITSTFLTGGTYTLNLQP